jgi:folate-binding protein YgfZ
MSDSSQISVESTAVQDTGAASLPLSPLTAALGAISLTGYRGAQTAEVFSSVSGEVAALLTRGGVYDLGWRSFIRCAGRDRVRLLNGVVTNSVKGLEENTGCYAFVLNAQGRIQGDLDIYRRPGDPDALWLQTDCTQVEALTAFFRHYIIMDQVTLEPQSAWTALGIAGPDAASKLSALGLTVDEISPVHLTETIWRDKPVVVVAAYSPRLPRYEIWVDSNAVLDLWKALTGAGLVACGSEAVEQVRILEGTPAYGIDIADRDLPQETNQMRALNFTKGCYLGQEIVERIRSRGNVHRTLSGFRLEGDPPPVKAAIEADGKVVGEITSAARISIPEVGERVLALGRLRREALESKAALTANGNAVTAFPLPFEFAGTE